MKKTIYLSIFLFLIHAGISQTNDLEIPQIDLAIINANEFEISEIPLNQQDVTAPLQLLHPVLHTPFGSIAFRKTPYAIEQNNVNEDSNSEDEFIRLISAYLSELTQGYQYVIDSMLDSDIEQVDFGGYTGYKIKIKWSKNDPSKNFVYHYYFLTSDGSLAYIKLNPNDDKTNSSSVLESIIEQNLISTIPTEIKEVFIDQSQKGESLSTDNKISFNSSEKLPENTRLPTDQSPELINKDKQQSVVEPMGKKGNIESNNLLVITLGVFLVLVIFLFLKNQIQ